MAESIVNKNISELKQPKEVSKDTDVIALDKFHNKNDASSYQQQYDIPPSSTEIDIQTAADEIELNN